MKGTRNKFHGLWDMPIYPSTIQENYILPPSIASLMKRRKEKYHNAKPNRSCKKTQRQLQKIDTLFDDD